LPFDNASFDAVASTEFLEHVAKVEAEAVLHEIWRVLRPGGHVILSTPDAEFENRKNKKKSPWHVYEWGVYELRDHLVATGWTVRDLFWYFVPLQSIEPYLPPTHRGRMEVEWLKAVLGPASGERGNLASYVVQKPPKLTLKRRR
jgi:SAM-dependent methyltransferase